ncbi:hypothetical protein KAU19_06310 [Candidatus Parcubacteria bacterium]|nr:hypothetical protein [Candidatus Parcubacteria bacterium]
MADNLKQKKEGEMKTVKYLTIFLISISVFFLPAIVKMYNLESVVFKELLVTLYIFADAGLIFYLFTLFKLLNKITLGMAIIFLFIAILYFAGELISTWMFINIQEKSIFALLFLISNLLFFSIIFSAIELIREGRAKFLLDIFPVWLDKEAVKLLK